MVSVCQREWIALAQDFEIGPFRFYADGRCSVAGRPLDHVGKDEVLSIEAKDGPTFYFKFEESTWYLAQ